MNKILNYVKDIIRCAVLGVLISLGVAVLSGIVCLFIYGFNALAVFDGINRVIYFVGAMGMFLSAGFFMKRDGTRPLIYNSQWKDYFKKLNIGFVIMFIGIFILSTGVLLQYILQALFQY